MLQYGSFRSVMSLRTVRLVTAVFVLLGGVTAPAVADTPTEPTTTKNTTTVPTSPEDESDESAIPAEAQNPARSGGGGNVSGGAAGAASTTRICRTDCDEETTTDSGSDSGENDDSDSGGSFSVDFPDVLTVDDIQNPIEIKNPLTIDSLPDNLDTNIATSVKEKLSSWWTTWLEDQSKSMLEANVTDAVCAAGEDCSNLTSSASQASGGGGGRDPGETEARTYFQSEAAMAVTAVPAPGDATDIASWIDPDGGFWSGAWTTYQLLSVAVVPLFAIPFALAFGQTSERERKKALKQVAVSFLLIFVGWLFVAVVLHVTNGVVQGITDYSTTTLLDSFGDKSELVSSFDAVGLFFMSMIYFLFTLCGVIMTYLLNLIVYLATGMLPLFFYLRAYPHWFARAMSRVGVSALGAVLMIKLLQAGTLTFLAETQFTRALGISIGVFILKTIGMTLVFLAIPGVLLGNAIPRMYASTAKKGWHGSKGGQKWVAQKTKAGGKKGYRAVRSRLPSSIRSTAKSSSGSSLPTNRQLPSGGSQPSPLRGRNPSALPAPDNVQTSSGSSQLSHAQRVQEATNGPGRQRQPVTSRSDMDTLFGVGGSDDDD
jgi:succinate dehydrogenase hydrophobic anchor subunit